MTKSLQLSIYNYQFTIVPVSNFEFRISNLFRIWDLEFDIFSDRRETA